ncbi:ribonuclease H1-like [Lineus longissimus]|uniref:ribonuclease H1-like n=1 Tax=Lineus longissimus TaxID=88925 RepID=UPI002B4E66C0
MFRLWSISSLISHCRKTFRMPFYAVSRGRHTGVYNSWSECQEQVKGFSGAKFKKFSAEGDAWSFVHAAAPQAMEVPKAKHKPLPTQPVTKQSGPPRKSILLDDIPSHGIGGFGYQNPASSSHLQKKEEDKAQILKKLDVISQEMQKLNKTALGLRKLLKEHDETGSSDQAPHTLVGKRQREEQISGSNKKQRRQKQKEPDLFSGSDADHAKAVEDPISVYTDGCCHSNGRKKAAAGIGVYWGPDDPNNVAARLRGRQTNNRAEIQAVCKALRQAQQMRKASVIVYTDSQFLINSITKWIHKWKRNGWKLTDGTIVKNKDDFEELDELQKGMTVKYVHVKGHSGVHGNEQADQLANQGARKPDHENFKFSFEDSESDDSD